MVESAAAHNLLAYVRAFQTISSDCAANAIKCAGGVAAFMGAKSPLTAVKGAGPEITDDDLESAEAWFHKCGAEQVVFELAPWISAESSERLRSRGYAVVDSEDVVVRRPPFEAPGPLRPVTQVDSTVWPELMIRVNQGIDFPQWPALVRACAVLPDAIHFGVFDSDGAGIACAQVLPTRNVGIFANDATLDSERGRGAQTATIQERLRAVRTRSFSCLVAEVAPNSTSERNYLRCGFELAYTRAHRSRKVV